MQHQQERRAGGAVLAQMWKVLSSVKAESNGETNSVDHISSAMSNLAERRNLRENQKTSELPVLMWVLLVVGGVFFDEDERILFDGVVGAVVEDDFGHALGAGLDDVAFVERDTVVGGDPTAGIGLLHAHRAVERGEVRLLGIQRTWLRCSPSYSLESLHTKIVDDLDAAVNELREGQAHAEEKYDEAQ